MTNDRVAMGNLLKEAREYLGLSQDEVARVLGIPRTAISLLETAQRKVDALELKRLSELYQRPIGFFTGEEGSVDPVPEAVSHLARAASALTDQDREELLNFAAYLQARAKK